MSQSKCVAYPPYTGDKRLVLEGLIDNKLLMIHAMHALRVITLHVLLGKEPVLRGRLRMMMISE